MAIYKIEEVEGIGPALSEKLGKAGIKTTEDMLNQCKTVKQRKEVAEKSGISETQILKFANMVDLFRLKGVGGEYAELLEAAGVDTVPELAQRKAENLAKKMEEINEQKKLVRKTPTLNAVTDWIEQAKKLPRVIEY